MSNLGTMIAEIRGEIRRSGMDPQIRLAIGAAILFLKDKRFKWNELSFTLDLIANRYDYGTAQNANIGRLASIDSAKLVSPEWTLDPMTIEELRSRQVGSSVSNPTHYAFYESKLWFFPTPNSSSLDVSILGLLELSDTAQSSGSQIVTRSNIASLPDNYTTAWFTDGYEIVKAWAKGYIYHHNLRNANQSDVEMKWFGGLSDDQEKQIGKLGGSNFVRPTVF